MSILPILLLKISQKHPKVGVNKPAELPQFMDCLLFCQTPLSNVPNWLNVSAPVGERSIAISLSGSVCVFLSASISLKPLDRSSRNLLCRSPMAVARSFSGGVAICYILPVLWMTSRWAVVGRMEIRG